MLFKQFALTALLGVTSVLALSVKQSHVAFITSKQQPVALRTITNQFQKLDKPLVIEWQNETIELVFSVERDQKPQYASLALGPVERGVEAHYSPIVKDNEKEGMSVYKFRIPIQRLSDSLLHYGAELHELLTASLILANKNGGPDNVFVELFDLSLAFGIDKKLSLPARFQSLPEIKHIFNAAPTTVSPWFAQMFSFIVLGCSLSLLLVWFRAGIFSSARLPQNTVVAIYYLGFVGAIIGLEYVFTQYYLGASIFKTLENAFYVSAPGLIIGCKLLVSLTK
ncbi:LAQU0S02e00562g1_1 [Lachancea quebecensis]|uniref:LAQU0S02e00562g1_1 n=1 Tax=Lachancea quebecensis TaxID=1654605 RepID=A0A0P1KMX8_9SACH|nr:LAQU0S02e00562g1_1 [Lachancea quebecensis]